MNVSRQLKTVLFCREGTADPGAVCGAAQVLRSQRRSRVQRQLLLLQVQGQLLLLQVQGQLLLLQVLVLGLHAHCTLHRYLASQLPPFLPKRLATWSARESAEDEPCAHSRQSLKEGKAGFDQNMRQQSEPRSFAWLPSSSFPMFGVQNVTGARRDNWQNN